MASILKVDQIQTAAGGTPTAADLGINTTGTVLQVVTTSSNTETNLSSNSSFADIGLSASITPKFDNSRILILAQIQVNHGGEAGGGGGGIRVLKNDVEFQRWANDATSDYNLYTSMADHIRNIIPLNLVDTVSSTSAITYKVQGVNYGSNSRLRFNESTNATGTQVSTMTLIEIAG